MTDIRKIQMSIRELMVELGFDKLRSLLKAAQPIDREELRRAADAVMRRHQPPQHEED